MSRSVQRPLPPMELERVQSGSDRPLKSLQSWKDMVTRALGRAGLSGKSTASDLGISESQFSSQLAYDGKDKRDHLSFWRMRDLPPEFWEELLPMIADFYDLTLNGSPREREDAEIGRLLREAMARASR